MLDPRQADERSGLLGRRRKQAQDRGGDDAESSFGADEELLQVVAGVVLAQGPQPVPHPSIRRSWRRVKRRAAAICDIDNQASARVMEKAGMNFEGVLRRHTLHPNIAPEPRDCRMYAKVKA